MQGNSNRSFLFKHRIVENEPIIARQRFMGMVFLMQTCQSLLDQWFMEENDDPFIEIRLKKFKSKRQLKIDREIEERANKMDQMEGPWRNFSNEKRSTMVTQEVVKKPHARFYHDDTKAVDRVTQKRKTYQFNYDNSDVVDVKHYELNTPERTFKEIGINLSDKMLKVTSIIDYESDYNYIDYIQLEDKIQRQEKQIKRLTDENQKLIMENEQLKKSIDHNNKMNATQITSGDDIKLVALNDDNVKANKEKEIKSSKLYLDLISLNKTLVLKNMGLENEIDKLKRGISKTLSNKGTIIQSLSQFTSENKDLVNIGLSIYVNTPSSETDVSNDQIIRTPITEYDEIDIDDESGDDDLYDHD